ncbi:MAG TPA: hypothetical protein VFT79_11355 [Solirubrobacterales bacterium]|nr:hypothetical protein [Solirubrobacterales bacterium]
MEGTQRDSTQDWVVPRGTVPSVGELEARIDEALVVARASEEGVREVGEIALDAARQARRAAEAAEVSAKAAVEVAQAPRPAGPVSDTTSSPTGEDPASSPPTGREAEGQTSREVVIDPLQRFNERADAVAARLRKLGQVPV